jgi:alpha-N-acetylglucosaminidase
MSSVYENTVNNGGQESIITGRPSFKENPGGTTNTKRHYQETDLVTAWKMLDSCMDELGESDGYRYDLVDVTRQVLADHASILQQDVASKYAEGDLHGFREAADRFLGLVDDMDALERYQQDPYHCSVVKTHMHAVRSSSVALDYII